MNKWHVTMNPMMGKKKFGVCRIINPNEPEHSGNREIYKEWFENRKEAEEMATYLNMMEAKNAK